ncbi:type I restriction enzyme HsdR N-terminal domain-containing protein [Aquimarina sp. SS2-1]|uniref:type I restriction enzyme HsdR N-terminal domain-containing protein n=1 Tax=Aquimarina besae TaxID=3342247 RepID=UPI00366CD73D
MQNLNFPAYQFRFKSSENKVSIFDRIRKKFIILTPEEWVRQHTTHYLIEDKKYPESLMNVEKLVKLNDTNKRYDIIIFNPDGSIFLIVECKAPTVKISQEVFDQIARYNLALDAEYLMITNGLDHYFCQMDYNKKRYTFLEDIPDYR